MLYDEQKELDLAKSEFEEGVRLDPQNARDAERSRRILMQMGASNQAMEYFRKCQEIAPDFDRPYLNMAALSYLNADRIRDAHDLLSEYLARTTGRSGCAARFAGS